MQNIHPIFQEIFNQFAPIAETQGMKAETQGMKLAKAKNKQYVRMHGNVITKTGHANISVEDLEIIERLRRIWK